MRCCAHTRYPDAAAAAAALPRKEFRLKDISSRHQGVANWRTKGNCGLRRAGSRLRCVARPAAAASSRHRRVLTGDFEKRGDFRSRSLLPRRAMTASKLRAAAGGCENVAVENSELVVYGQALLSGVPGNIMLSPDAGKGGHGLPNGAFLGFEGVPASRHVLPVGVLENSRFMCCYRFKIWWMAQRMGSTGAEIPFETQFLLTESKDKTLEKKMEPDAEDQTIYTVFLPLLEGPFRTALQGNTASNKLELCVESGDPRAHTSEGLRSVYINAGPDPFKVIQDAVTAVQGHLQTFRRRDQKKMPGILDYFGWCTWDAFYTDVTAERVMEGLTSLANGGVPVRFLIIDDGWQSITDDNPTGAAASSVTAGTQYSSRLTRITENEKFDKNGQSGGLRDIIQAAKNKLNVKYVYLWHALAGYWGGVQPGLKATDKYEPKVTHPVHTPTVLSNQPDMEVDSLTVNGIGVVNPEKAARFFDDMHQYLAGVGVDGVKVDSQAILETLGGGFGGRVSIVRKFQQALEASVASNFPDNGCIACMCHNTDTIYSSAQTAIARASDDFWPRDPASHTIHIASVAYNTLFLGEFMQPDWDMFQSLHPAAEFHAAARAIGGCAVYVSDKPGQHDFDLLKKIVLPDGTVLRAKLPGRPTRDCLFTDPTRNGYSLLKIWNMNEHGGVLGAFNCQGASWCKDEKRYRIHDRSPKEITSSVRATDVEHLGAVAGDEWGGECIVYSHRGGELIRLPKAAALPLTLKMLEFEIFTMFPLKNLGSKLSFAPIGLLGMFNSGAAIEALSYEVNDHGRIEMFNREGAMEPLESLARGGSGDPVGDVPRALIKMAVRGCGEFGAYSSKEPRSVQLDETKGVAFSYDSLSGLVKFVLPVPSVGKHWDISVEL